MLIRLLKIFIVKLHSLVLPSIAFTARVEDSEISKKAKIWRHCVLQHSKIDAYSYIGPNSRIIYGTVGRFCSIGSGSTIGMGSHTLNYISSSSIFTAITNGTGTTWTKKQTYEEHKPVNIGNDVWIGIHSMIMGGVNVGNGAVIGAGAVVTKDVPPYAIVGGVPAKIIRYRFTDDIIDKLERSEWWTLDDSILKANIGLFQSPLDNDNLSKLIQLTQKQNV